METYYRILEVYVKRRLIPDGWTTKEIDAYKYQSPKHYQLDQQFDSELEAELAIKKYGNNGELYIIQKFYRIPFSN